jgi:hypothetical protein
VIRRATLLGLLALVASLLPATTTVAAPGDPLQFQGFFDGSTLPSPMACPGSIGINETTHNVYVSEGCMNRLTQFDSEGHPANFSSTGTPQTSPGAGNLIIDNSGGPNQGNIYGLGGDGLWSVKEDGTPNGSGQGGPGVFYPIFEGSTSGYGCGGLTIAANGNILWMVGSSFEFSGAELREMTPSGIPVGKGKKLLGKFFGSNCFPVPDSEGFVYMEGAGSEPPSLHKWDPTTWTDLGDTGMPTTDRQWAVDPANDDLYVVRDNKIEMVPHTEPLTKQTPTVVLELPGGAFGLAFDATGETAYVSEPGGAGPRISIYRREPVKAPWSLNPMRVDSIRSQEAKIHSGLISGGSQVTYHFEYGTDTTYGQTTPEITLPYSQFPVKFDAELKGLKIGTTYHVRLVATNSAGTTYGADKVFKTFPIAPGVDPCPNALARKQTGARALPNCRAYELVSSHDTGGYDVESYLSPGQTPFAGYPDAEDPPTVLYSTHSGPVPGPWKATNRGPDPYIATRGESGWTTNYVGLPSDINPAAGTFSSVLGAADSGLRTFAFAGANLCSPCFSSGLETGIPVRLPSGDLVQGMAGSLDPGVASAKPEGKVAKMISADGRHLIFASKYAFESGANNNGTDLTIYDRDLNTGTTQIVSRSTGGAPLTGAGIGEYDLSADGSRVVYGTRVSVSGENEYVHPYMHIGNSSTGVDLAPGATEGVLYAGMTADGSTVFFTATNQLLGADTDSSADLYAADVDAGGTVNLSLLTPGGAGACNPVANSAGPHWNTTVATATCDAVAIGGGGGVAAGDGSAYVLSPQQLDGAAGTADQPNLYTVKPGGDPQFVATLEPSNPLVLDSVARSGKRETGDFQITPDGHFAVFPSALLLTGVDNFGFRSIFRYDAQAEHIDCVSCDPSGTTDSSFAGDALLAPQGLSLTDDGTVFFTSRAALVLSDANGRKDIYEWEGGEPQLISSGIGAFDSGLLTASSDGVDVHFFTQEKLAPEEDDNGAQMRIYDARSGGGFFYLPADVPCAASDECHGAGTASPGPPDIKTSGQTTEGNVLVCPKKKVKKNGRCVKKKPSKKKGKKKARATHHA